MYSDENKSSSLARFLNTFDYAIIDTCSLMDEAFPEWMDALRNAKPYRKKGQRILVPRRCYDELKKHAQQHQDDSKRIDAKRGLRILRHAKLIGLLTITKKDKNENFADNAIYVKVSTDRLFSKILVITQDKKLASDLRALNQLKSQTGRPLEVCKIVGGARLIPNQGDGSIPREHRGHAAPRDNNPKPQTKKPSTAGAEEVLLNDARLSAVINNNNYPSEKKKADCLAQLHALDKLPESVRNQISLLVPVARLREIVGQQDAAAKPAEPKPAKKPVAKPEPKPEAKPAAPAKEKLWYGKAATLEQAFLDCADHYHMVFHEKSVSYFAQAHGPLDLTREDLSAICALAESLIKGEDRISFLYRGMTLLVQKVEAGYKAWIDVNLLPKALLPLAKSDRPKPAKPVEEPASEPAPEAKPEPKKKSPAKRQAKAEQPAPEQPVEAHVAEEKPAKKPAKSPKKAQKLAESEKPAEEKPEEPKPAPKKKKAPAKKPAEPTSEDPAKPEQKPARKKPAPKAEEPAPEEDPEVAQAKKADRRLLAVLNNPHYELGKKIKDVNAQIELLSRLDPSKIQGLKMSVEKLQAWLQEHPNE